MLTPESLTENPLRRGPGSWVQAGAGAAAAAAARMHRHKAKVICNLLTALRERLGVGNMLLHLSHGKELKLKK